MDLLARFRDKASRGGWRVTVKQPELAGVPACLPAASLPSPLAAAPLHRRCICPFHWSTRPSCTLQMPAEFNGYFRRQDPWELGPLIPQLQLVGALPTPWPAPAEEGEEEEEEEEAQA